ncbi:leucine--tRNA ligase [Candidatus Roizmanbacteria bacterium CG_4_9_14_0_2_um_filter_35_15]|uniref:Leucine--tRNA ligase n=1 Tax=Candidatus Roizmanbacteria bacterium CG_4_9_14_0_2_um_filter_35_15 TaxID=1974836 RepID=A0A2M8F552_9BACT|nr:MAG: leucine--tRNA ligase [Candidatus Roizmanbacteria bacterium CG_4_9_14_0_2_um_filter_35_15]
MNKYIPKEFEKKWVKEWKNKKLNVFDPDSKKKKYYVLVEWPYTSGDLHIGHWFTFTIPDVLSRYKRMNDWNVFFPMGYDAFGLPAENAAIEHKVHPQDWTMKNIATMTKQFQQMGTMIDWDWMTIACVPEYYRWNQWIFLKMYEQSLAFRGKALSNWCPSCQTVLANENIENGKCWRCGSQVIQKEVEQWFLKITEYAERLIWPDKPKASPERSRRVDWPISVRVGQNNWIGKSEGLIINFGGIEVFTTRPETIDGASFLVLSPEHPFVIKMTTKDNLNKVKKYFNQSTQKTEMERKENKDKTGVFTGSYVKNPVTGKKIPVWVADYVLFGYGTGAIMAVPAEDERDREFATKHSLPIIKTSLKAKPNGKKRSIYHLRDWSISRQRYWGTPVPMIHCPTDGIVPVPYKDLPVELPYEVDFTPHGKPPLATNEKWLNVKCPNCGKPAKRDAETLDTFFDSSWYFLRYVNPKYDRKPFDEEKVKKLTPVDVYFGGSEHTLGHTLYARFFTKFFHDEKLLNYDEFALQRVQHGVVLGPDGNRMSKSKGNVINPDDVVDEYGSDTVRLYLCFMMPYEGTSSWSTKTIAGVNRFLTRVWEIYQKQNQKSKIKNQKEDEKLVIKLKKTIKKVTEDIGNIKMNTAIAAMMEFLNEWERNPQELSKENAKKFLQILSPFAPFLTEEIWHSVFGEKNSIHLSTWPKVEGEIIEEEVTIPVQVNGKLRDTIKIQNSKVKSQKEVEKLALNSEKIKKYLTGKPKKIIYVPGKIINLII